MNIKTLKERIEKAQEKIIKKQGTIEKKSKSIEKKATKLEKMGVENPKEANRMEYANNGEREIYSILYDIHRLKEDIIRLEKEVKEISTTLEKYKEQLKEQDKEMEIYKQEVPTVFKDLEATLVERWDKWDLERKESIKKAYSKLGYSEFFKSFNRADYDFMYKTKEQIHNQNLKDAQAIIIDMFYRVKNITGKIKDWDSITTDQDNNGFMILNGFVKGEQGTAKIESILAGGYNIQRLHIRVLVKSI